MKYSTLISENIFNLLNVFPILTLIIMLSDKNGPPMG